MLKQLTIISIVAICLSNANAQCVKGNCENGNGTYNFGGGTIYTGQFVDGSPNGKGTIKFKDGQTYTGSFVNGMKEAP